MTFAPSLRLHRLAATVAACAIGLLIVVCGTAPDARAQSSPAPSGAPPADDTVSSASIHARQLLVRGMTQAFLEDYDAAIAYFEQALELAPQEATVLSALADAHAAQDDLTSALFYAREAREYAPANPAYALQLARLQRTANRPADAIDTYTSIVERFPSSVDAWHALGQLHADQGRPDAALQAYESLLEHATGDRADVHAEMLPLYRDTDDDAGLERSLKALTDLRPTDPLYPRLLGQLYAQQGRVNAAIALYESLLDDASPGVDIVMHLSTLYRRTGATDEAESLLRRFIDDDGASTDQLVQRARALYEDGTADASAPDTSLVEAAERLLRQALDQSPDDPRALELLGTLRFEDGAYAEAGALLERALQQNPRAPERWTRAATAFYRAGLPERAVTVADEGLLLFPGQFDLARVAGLALTELGRNNEALRQVDEAIRLLDDIQVDTVASARAELLAAKGRLHHRLGEMQPAETAFDAALSAAPGHAVAARHYAAYLADRGVRLDRALALAQRSVDATAAMSPSHAAALATLGWVHLRRGAPEAARDALQRAVNAGADDAQTLEHLGDAHDALGNDAAARQFWKRALDRAPDRDTVEQKLNAEQSSRQ